MYTVEFWSNKECWEVWQENLSWEEAIEHFKSIIDDGYNARLTWEKGE